MVTSLAAQGCTLPGLRADQTVFAVVVKALHASGRTAFLAEVAPGVVAEAQVLEGHEAIADAKSQ